jgi:hypothetical protein
MPLLSRLFLLGLTCLAVLPSGACNRSRPSATLHLRSTETDRQMTQNFASAVFTRGPRGEYDIILVDQNEGLSRATNAPGKPLQTSSAAPLTHLLHVRVLYKPKRAIRPGPASASNASVHWAVLSRDGRIDYTGAGLAQISGDDKIHVRLRGIRLSPNAALGDLDDPIGATTLNATFRATRDASTVRDALSILYDSGAARDADYPGPPARNAAP